MEDLIEQANEIQESMSRTYGVPEEVDEADLEAGMSFLFCAFSAVSVIHVIYCSQNWMLLGMILRLRPRPKESDPPIYATQGSYQISLMTRPFPLRCAASVIRPHAI